MSFILTVALHKVSYLVAFIFLLAGKSIKDLNYVELFCKLSFKLFVHCQTKPCQGEVYSCSIGCASGKSKTHNLLFHAENTVLVVGW
jgi:hypothetical protein